MALSSLTFQQTLSLNWTAKKSVTGLPQALQNVNQPSWQLNLGTSKANNVAGGSDELYFAVLTITASSTSTIDLTSFTDILSQTTVSLARLKYARFKLLGSSEFAPDGVTAGTACTGVTIGNAVSNANLLFMSSTTPTFDLKGGAYGQAVTFEDPGASGITVDSTHKNVLITNDDSGHSAVLAIVLVGGTT